MSMREYKPDKEGEAKKLGRDLDSWDIFLQGRHTENELRVGQFICTNRKSHCRCCGQFIPNDVLKYSVRVLHSYGGLGYRPVVFSYCLKCSKKMIERDIEDCRKYAIKMKKLLKSVSHKDKLFANRRREETQLIGDI